MNKVQSIKFNFIMNVILTMSSFIFPLITFPYVSRILSPSGMGKVSLAISFVYYFNLFAQLGIPTYGVRACAKVRDDKEKLSKLVQELLIINIVMSFIVYLIFICVFFAVPRIKQDASLYLIISTTIFFNTIGVEWLYRGLEKYAYITLRSIIFKIIALLAMFLLVHQKNDYIIYGGISVFASSASNIFNFFHMRKYVNLKPYKNYEFRQHVKPIAIIFAMTCAATIYTNLDNVMLGFMKTDADVGYYNAAVKIRTIILNIVTSLGTVILPRASYYIQNKEYEKFWQISHKAINFVFIIATPLTIYFMVYASEGVLFLSGSAYSDAILPMIIIMPTCILVGISNITGIQILLPMGKERFVLYSEIIGAMIDLSLNIFLIPRFASTGAAIGTLVAEFFVLSYQIFVLRKNFSLMFKNINYYRIIFSSIFAMIVSLIFKSFNLKPFFSLLCSSVTFGLVYLCILLIFKESLVKEIFRALINRTKLSNK